MKLCVLFPGIGYTVERPLLYYTKKLALGMGYEVKSVSYHDLSKDIGGDDEKKAMAYKMALEQAEECLKDVKWDEYSDVLFVGKSIGTIVSAALAEKIKCNVRFIYMTPLSYTFKYAKADSGIVFTGLSDPWVNPDEIEESARRLGLPCYQYAEANHSLETKDVIRNLEILKEVMEICCTFVVL